MEVSPIQILARLALVATCVIGFAVGFRTLAIWWRTRCFPELAIGTNLISIGAGGVLLVVLGESTSLVDSAGGPALWAVTLVVLGVHVLCMGLTNWRVFRPTEKWPAAICAAIVVGMAIFFVWGWREFAQTNARTLYYESVRLLTFAWTSFECFRYAARLRRRAALGLGDPVIAHRIGLWGIASAAQIVTTSLAVFYGAVWQMRLFEAPVGMILMSLFGLCGAVCIALAFFPPRPYARWIEDRSAQS